VTSTHGKMNEIKRMLEGVKHGAGALEGCCEQLSRAERWRWLLKRDFSKFTWADGCSKLPRCWKVWLPWPPEKTVNCRF